MSKSRYYQGTSFIFVDVVSNIEKTERTAEHIEKEEPPSNVEEEEIPAT